MGKRLYDAFELCLQALEIGESVEACLKRFPELADELRPMLYAAEQALNSAAITIPQGIATRGRARLLQRAAEMREVAARPRRSRFQFRKLAYVFALVVIFLTSGTGLVQASNGALPGDNLYTIKRTWEDLRLVLAFNPATRDALEELYEDERYEEIYELFEEGRIADIAFSGVVTEMTESLWTVSNIPVRLDAGTSVAAGIEAGDAVLVQGMTQPQTMQVLATAITFANGNNLQVVGEDEAEGDDDPTSTPTPRSTATPLPTDRPTLTPTPSPSPTPGIIVTPTEPGEDDDQNDNDNINDNDNDNINGNINDNDNDNINDNDNDNINDSDDNDNINNNDNDNINDNDNDND